MIIQLQIKNFAIIDDLTIPFGPGFNVITGETGAGKSIIIEALGLITGDKISGDVVRSGRDEAEVTAIFDTKKISRDLKKELVKLGFQNQNHLTLKRKVSTTNKNKAFLDGKPISVSALRSISPYLLEMSSQHEHQRLLNEDSHLEYVDRFGGLHEMRDGYALKYNNYIYLRNRLSDLEKLASSKNEQRDFLTYQIAEIDSANLVDGEEENLEKERNVIKHAASLFEKLKESEHILYSSDNSVTGALDKVGELLESAGEIDSDIKAWQTLIDQASASAGDLSRCIQDYLEKLDVDPGRLDEIEERIYEIRKLKKKYNGSISDVLQKRDEFTEKLKLIDNCDNEIEKLTEELKTISESLKVLANQLSNARQKAAEKLSRSTQEELKTLGLGKTTFAPGHFKLPFEQSDEFGLDRFGFLISPNPGEPLKPLSRIASGGELSRIMLAIKNVLLGKVGLAALEVFDEVDVGIGGANAEVVGKKLNQMSKIRQIICITHLPQVASFGDHHVVVSKESLDKRTVTRFKLLNDMDRVDEIARMLGGIKVTKATKDHAKEMLNRSVK